MSSTFRLRWLWVLVFSVLVAPAALADNRYSIEEAATVQEAVDSIKATLEEQGRKVVATVNHGAAAAGVGLSLRDTQVILYSDPDVDTHLIRQRRTMGIDLPNKILVWQNAAGQIRVTANPVSYLALRHRLRLGNGLLDNLQRSSNQFDRDNGLVSVESKQSVEATVAAIRAAIQRAGLNSQLIDHAADGKRGLPPTQLILFGNPRVGTLLMQNEQQIGIDLPLKMLVWKRHDGQVVITYNDPVFIGKRHDIEGLDDVLLAMTTTLQNLAAAGATPPN